MQCNEGGIESSFNDIRHPSHIDKHRNTISDVEAAMILCEVKTLSEKRKKLGASKLVRPYSELNEDEPHWSTLERKIIIKAKKSKLYRIRQGLETADVKKKINHLLNEVRSKDLKIRELRKQIQRLSHSLKARSISPANAMELKVKLMRNGKTPLKATPGSAGWDLYCPYDVDILRHATAKINLRIKIECPSGFFGMIKDRSSIAASGVHVVAGVIDEDYRGELSVCLRNTTERAFHLKQGERIAQLLILRAEKVEIHECAELTETERGNGGYGSTGK